MSSSADPARTEASRLELVRTGAGDRYFDYCLQPYRPRRPPGGKLRAENLLWRSLELAGLLERARPPLEALRRSLGRDMIVWGAKHDGCRLFWELYVYDPQKEDPRATVAGIAETLAPWLEVTPKVRESIPYMMVSFDLDEETLTRGSIDELNLYLTGTTEHEGRSYRARGSEIPELDNLYRFLEPKRDVDALLSLLTSSVSIDYAADPRTLAKVLIPELFACKRACVAKKRARDGLYFSGIDVDQLLFFLERFRYPKPLRDFAATCAPELDHLYFDVGVDYAPREGGGIDYPKTSFYGTL